MVSLKDSAAKHSSKRTHLNNAMIHRTESARVSYSNEMASISKRKKMTVGDDDVLSYYGSMSGETFASRRSRTGCTLRQHSIDRLARRLKEHSFGDILKPTIGLELPPSGPEIKRLNSSFHHYRIVVVMLGGLSFGCMVLLRLNISVAILKMVNQTALYLHENPNKTVDDFLAEGYTPGGEFDWNNEIQNMIMSWYMIAYTLPQIATTKLGLLIGSRLIVPISLSISALASLLTPISAYWGWEWVIVLRMLNGVGASAILPMMLCLIEKWMPYNEISLGLTIANILCAIVSASCSLITGYLASIHWSYAFYGPALATLIFSAIWLVLVTDSPDENRFVSQKELDLICGCCYSDAGAEDQRRAQQQRDTQAGDCKNNNMACAERKQSADSDESTDRNNKPTILDVLRVPSFYAYVAHSSIHNSSATCFFFILPAYLRQFLKIDISQNGLYCSMIQSGVIIAVIWPHLMMRLLQLRWPDWSITTARRITFSLGCLVVGGTWIYVGAFHEVQLVMFFLGRCFHGCSDVLTTASLMSNYASVGLSSLVFSMVNTVGNFSIVFTSTFVGWFLDYTGQSRDGWSWILVVLGFFQLVLMTIFCTLVRSGPINFNKGAATGRNSTNLQAVDPEQPSVVGHCHHYRIQVLDGSKEKETPPVAS